MVDCTSGLLDWRTFAFASEKLVVTPLAWLAEGDDEYRAVGDGGVTIQEACHVGHWYVPAATALADTEQ
jgi:hypothetical protein